MGYIQESQEILNELVGETIIKIQKSDSSGYSNEEEIHPTALLLICESGNEFRMYHRVDCCETVIVEDGLDELYKMIGHKILSAEVSSNTDDDFGKSTECCNAMKWTYYKFTTDNGYCDLRWVGSTSSDYSLEVTTEQTIKNLPLAILKGKCLYTTEYDSFTDYLKISCEGNMFIFEDKNNGLTIKNVNVKNTDNTEIEVEEDDNADVMDGVWFNEKIIKPEIIVDGYEVQLKLTLENHIIVFNIEGCKDSKFILREKGEE